jgi:hypothetical protein
MAETVTPLNEKDRFGLGDRERSEDQRLQDAEHHCVCADAERERQDCDGGNARVSQEPAYGISDVTQHCIHLNSP